MNEEWPVQNQSEIESRGFSIAEGWSDSLANELVVNSRQPHIMDERTGVPNDARKRFSDRDSAQKWYEKKNPSIYALRHENGELAGVIWFDGNERTEIDAQYTFAIRMYESARGQGLALPFMQETHRRFLESHDTRGIWLETDETNEAALHLYRKFGYEDAGMEYDRIRMVYHPETSQA